MGQAPAVELATSRQLWALYCITKRDHRNMGLTKQQASELISQYNKQPQGSKLQSSKVVKNPKDDFLAYIKEAMPSIVQRARRSLNLESEVVEDTTMMRGTGPNGTAKRYTFIGFGCAFVWIEYDKRSKKAKAIYEIALKSHLRECYDMFATYFSKMEMRSLSDKGCPLSALWAQDEGMQLAYYNTVARYMESQGVKNTWVRSRLD